MLADWTVHFDSPWALLAMAAAVLPLAAGARAWWRGRGVRWLSVAMQTLAVAAVALALAGPRAPVRSQAARPWLVLTDASASVRGQDTPIAWNRSLGRSDCTFAADVYAGARPPTAQETLSTRASAALAVAAAQVRLGQAGGVVIRTDGRFDAGDPWPGAAGALAAAGAPILIVPMDSPPADARVLNVTAQADAAGAVALSVSIASNAPQRRRLQVLRRSGGGNDSALLDRELNLLMDDRTTLRLADQAGGSAVRYVARLTPPDAISENDQAEALVLPRKRTVAAVAADPKSLAQFIGTIEGADLAAVGAAALPSRADELLQYSAMLIADDSGLLLTEAQRTAVAQYVRGGGGLVLMGSGPRRGSGDLTDPLNAALPLMANAFQRKPLDLRIVLDASGSMNLVTTAPGGGRQIKFDQAAQAVISLDRYLTPSDALEIIAFSDAPRRIYASGAAAIDFTAVRDALQQVRPNGSTKVAPALNLAADAAAGDNRAGLVVLVSDLDTQPLDVTALAGKFRQNKLELAVVAIAAGDEANPRYPVEDLAAALKAPLVRRGDLQGLAEIFGRFLSDARGDSVRRGQFIARFAGDALGLPAASAPLEAYVLSAAAEGADVLARAGADPIVARRTVGLGRSIGIAVPPAALNGPWWAWAKGSRLLPAAARWVMRPQSDSRFSGTLTRSNEDLHLVLDARDQSGPMNLLKLFAVVQPIEGAAAASTALLQTAPGHYEAPLSALSQGSLQVRDGSGAVRWQKALAPQYPPELAAVGADRANLERLAELTGGRIVDAKFVDRCTRDIAAQSLAPLWPWLLAMSLALMLIDWIMVRR